MQKHVMTSMLLMAAALASVGAMGNSEQAADKKDAGQGLTHITMWYSPTAAEVGPLPNDWTGYQKLKDELGIDLEADSLPAGANDQSSKLLAAAAADDLPDFFTVTDRDTWVNLVERGMLADLSDTYGKMPGRTAMMFDDAAIKYTTYSDGKNYGWATPSSVNPNEGLVIRKDWLDKLGLQVPETLDDFYNVMYAFTYNDPDGDGKDDTYGFGAYIRTFNYEAYPGRRFEPLMGAFGVEGTWDMHAASFGLMIKKPEFYQFMQFMKKMIDGGVIDPNWMALKQDDFTAEYKQGRVGCFRWQFSALDSKNNYAPFDANFPDGEFIVIEPPYGPDHKRSVGPVVAGKRIWAVSQKAVDEGKLDKIVQLMEWTGSGEGYMLCVFGREGIEYTLDANGNPVSTDGPQGFTGSVGQQYVQLRNLAANNKSDVEITSRYPDWTSRNGRTISPLETLRHMQAMDWTQTPGQDAMPAPSTDLKTYYEQGLAEFFTGNKALTQENWDAFIAQLDKLGAKEWEQQGYEFAKAEGYLQ